MVGRMRYWYCQKMRLGLHTVSIIFCLILAKIELCQKILVKLSRGRKNVSSGSWVSSCRQTDRHEEANRWFSQFLWMHLKTEKQFVWLLQGMCTSTELAAGQPHSSGVAICNKQRVVSKRNHYLQISCHSSDSFEQVCFFYIYIYSIEENLSVLVHVIYLLASVAYCIY